jgi:quinol monooxygenase YgiN
MKYVLIIHEVDDYTAWKTVFDEAAAIRKQAGEISYQVLTFEQVPNKIVHFSTWTSLEAAKHFFESPKLVQIRKKQVFARLSLFTCINSKKVDSDANLFLIVTQ